MGLLYLFYLNLFTSKLDLNLRKKLEKCNFWSIALCGAGTGTLWKIDHNYIENFEMWCWRRMEKISWTDRVRNEDVLHRVKEERNIVHTVFVEGRLTGLVTACVWIAFWNTLLKDGHKGREDEEKDISSYWFALRKVAGIGVWKRKHWIALSREVAGGSMDLSQDRPRYGRSSLLPWNNYLHFCFAKIICLYVCI